MSANQATLSRATEDFLYDAFYSAAIGASVVALYFLLVDSLQGRPFFTPALMGAVIFEGVDPANFTNVRLGLVAKFSMVHMAAFGAIGLALAFLVREVCLHAKRPAQCFVLFFLVFEGSFVVASTLLMPGVNQVLGPFRIFLANLFAAGSMAGFLYAAHHENAYRRLAHAVRPS